MIVGAGADRHGLERREVLVCREFPKVFGVVADTEIDACLLPRLLLENRNQHLAGGATQHGRAEHDDRVGRGVQPFECSPDRGACRHQVVGDERVVFLPGGSRDRNEHDVRSVERQLLRANGDEAFLAK